LKNEIQGFCVEKIDENGIKFKLDELFFIIYENAAKVFFFQLQKFT